MSDSMTEAAPSEGKAPADAQAQVGDVVGEQSLLRDALELEPSLAEDPDFTLRYQRLNERHRLFVGDLEGDLDLEVLRAVAARIGEVDEHLRHINERRGLGLDLFGRMVTEPKPGRAAGADQHQQTGGRNHHHLARQLERKSAFRTGARLAVLRLLFDFGFGRLGFGSCHGGDPVRSWWEGSRQATHIPTERRGRGPGVLEAKVGRYG